MNVETVIIGLSVVLGYGFGWMLGKRDRLLDRQQGTICDLVEMNAELVAICTKLLKEVQRGRPDDESEAWRGD